MKKLFLLLLASCIGLIGLQAQSSTYYVKGNAKILNPRYQLILKEDRQEWDPYFFIKIRIKDSVHVFTPNEVSEYKNDSGKTYVREALPNGPKVFMEVVEDGYLRLYFFIDKKFKRRYFIKKPDGLVMEMQAEKKGRKFFQKVLRKNWDECKKTKKLIDIAEFNRPSLKRTVRAHNRCKDIYIPRFKTFAAIGVGIAKPEMSYGIDVETVAFEGVYRNFTYNFKISYMAAVGISLPINQTNLSLESGLKFQTYKYNFSTVFSLNNPFDREFLSELTLTDISVPVDLQYTLPFEKYRPFFKFGFAPNYFVSNENQMTVRILSGSGELDRQMYQEKLKSFGIGMNIALGFQQELPNKNELQFTFGYHRRGATKSKRIYNFSTLYYTLGYSFGKNPTQKKRRRRR